MKNLFLIIILTMVLFVGCSSNDTTQQEDKNKLLLENLTKETDFLRNKYEENKNNIKNLNADISNLNSKYQEALKDLYAFKRNNNELSEEKNKLESENKLLKEIIFNSDHGVDYNQLTAEEKEQYENIMKANQNKYPYKISLTSFPDSEATFGEVKFDFNRDGKIETLYYYTEIGKDMYGDDIVKKCTIKMNGTAVVKSYDYDDGGEISTIGIADINTQDNYVEFYISKGRMITDYGSSIFRLTDEGIKQIDSFGDIDGISGDGKIYYWEGTLFGSSYSNENGQFDTDIVVSYYDFEKQEYVHTDQIIGKTITAPFEFILYKSSEDVIDGAPVTEQEKIRMSKGKIVKMIDEGDKLEVLALQNDTTQVKTEDGKVGWIGGFHMVWD